MTDIFTYSPRDGTATSRREARRDIRERLGVSSDPAPSARTTLRALDRMSDLLWAATDGALKIRLEDRNGNFVHIRDAIGAADPGPPRRI